MSAPPAQRRIGPQRSRIVIDLEKLQAANRRRRGRRVRRILTLLGVALIFVVSGCVAGAYVWWENYSRGPAYSLALLIDAARRNDTETVGSLVDSDRIAQNFIPQVMSRIPGRDPAAGVSGALRRLPVAGAPSPVLPNVRDSVRDEISRQAKDLAARSGAGDRMPLFLLALAIPRAVDEIDQQGDTATIKFKTGGSPVELTMARQNDALWKIVAVKDDALAARVAGSVAAESAPAVNKPSPASSANRQTAR